MEKLDTECETLKTQLQENETHSQVKKKKRLKFISIFRLSGMFFNLYFHPQRNPFLFFNLLCLPTRFSGFEDS